MVNNNGIIIWYYIYILYLVGGLEQYPRMWVKQCHKWYF